MKNKLILAAKVLAIVGCVAYAAMLVHGLWTLGFSPMMPWLLLGCGFVCIALAVHTWRITREVDEILANMQAITDRISHLKR